MSALVELKRHLRPGQVYRRKDLARWSTAVDRHVRQLVDEGRLEKVSAGVYMAPRKTRFENAPAEPQKLIETFLRDDRFLVVSPSALNSLGVGTTQLHNEAVVLPLALAKAREMDRVRLARAVKEFGSARAERLLAPVLDQA